MAGIIVIRGCAITLFCAFAASAQTPGVEKGRQELQAIQQQVESRKKELDLYRKQETDISRYVSFLKKQDDSAEKIRKKLGSELSYAQYSLSETERRQFAYQAASRFWTLILDAEAYRYTLNRANSFGYYGSGMLVSKLFLESAIYDKIAIIQKLRGDTVIVSRKLNMWKDTGKQLASRSKKLENEQEERRRRYQEKITVLNETREKYNKTLKELEDLKNSAQSLIRFLENVEKRSAKQAKSENSREIPVPRRSLPWPAEGKVVTFFGREAVPALRTWVVREGIKIAAVNGAPVASVAQGSVIYSGPFRSYGKVVIVDHGRSFFTVYGLLGSIDLKKGDPVMAGSVLGHAGADTQVTDNAGSSAVYFEIRSGVTALNPLDWLIHR